MKKTTNGLKISFCVFFIIIFSKIFFFSPTIDWQSKYNVFSVPAFTWPGGDARNIQVSAYCASQGYSYFGKNECMEKAEIVKSQYPDAVVPVFNYPSVWPRIYSVFADNTEKFFMNFWALNATLMVVGVLLFSVKYNYVLLPFILFSPITLLTMERGNIDAATFFLTFIPLLMLHAESKKFHGFFIGIATAAKIYPIFGYLALISFRKSFVQNSFIFGALISAPVALYSLSEVRYMLDATTIGFSKAYGLTSVTTLPYVSNHPWVAAALILCYLIIALAVIVKFLRNELFKKNTDDQISRLQLKDLIILKVSLIIFIGTFFVFTNWSYRLIFLIPALLILSRQKSGAGKLVFWNIFAIFWLPVIPQGWYLQNIACYILNILSIFFLIRIYKVESNAPKGAA